MQENLSYHNGSYPYGHMMTSIAIFFANLGLACIDDTLDIDICCIPLPNQNPINLETLDLDLPTALMQIKLAAEEPLHRIVITLYGLSNLFQKLLTIFLHLHNDRIFFLSRALHGVLHG